MTGFAPRTLLPVQQGSKKQNGSWKILNIKKICTIYGEETNEKKQSPRKDKSRLQEKTHITTNKQLRKRGK